MSTKKRKKLDPMRHVIAARDAFRSQAAFNAARGQEVLKIVVGYEVWQEPMILRGRISADTGMSALPDPPPTAAEMERVTFAAKMEFLRCMRRRKSEPKP